MFGDGLCSSLFLFGEKHRLIYNINFAETLSYYHETGNSLSFEDILTITPIDHSKDFLSLHRRYKRNDEKKKFAKFANIKTIYYLCIEMLH